MVTEKLQNDANNFAKAIVELIRKQTFFEKDLVELFAKEYNVSENQVKVTIDDGEIEVAVTYPVSDAYIVKRKTEENRE